MSSKDAIFKVLFDSANTDYSCGVYAFTDPGKTIDQERESAKRAAIINLQKHYNLSVTETDIYLRWPAKVTVAEFQELEEADRVIKIHIKSDMVKAELGARLRSLRLPSGVSDSDTDNELFGSLDDKDQEAQQHEENPQQLFEKSQQRLEKAIQKILQYEKRIQQREIEARVREEEVRQQIQGLEQGFEGFEQQIQGLKQQIRQFKRQTEIHDENVRREEKEARQQLEEARHQIRGHIEDIKQHREYNQRLAHQKHQLEVEIQQVKDESQQRIGKCEKKITKLSNEQALSTKTIGDLTMSQMAFRNIIIRKLVQDVREKATKEVVDVNPTLKPDARDQEIDKKLASLFTACCLEHLKMFRLRGNTAAYDGISKERVETEIGKTNNEDERKCMGVMFRYVHGRDPV